MKKINRRTQEKAENRKKLLQIAADSLKSKGLKETSIDAVMSGLNLTHGSFYAYFKNKNQMIKEALLWSIDHSHDKIQRLLGKDNRNPLTVFLDFYISPKHRSSIAEGCPVSALCRDFSKENKRMRNYFAKILSETIDLRRNKLPHKGRILTEDEWMGIMCTYVGAMVVSRSCEGTELSDKILNSARTFLREWEDL